MLQRGTQIIAPLCRPLKSAAQSANGSDSLSEINLQCERWDRNPKVAEQLLAEVWLSTANSLCKKRRRHPSKEMREILRR